MSTKLVKRFLTPFAPLRPEPYKVTLDWGTAMESSVGERFKRDRVEPAIQLVRSVTKPIEDQYTKAQKRNKLTAALQLALWNKGFFKGLKDRRGRAVTYETAVDGLSGRMTNAAMQAARNAGYTINKDGSLSRVSDINGDMVQNAKAPVETTSTKPLILIQPLSQQASISPLDRIKRFFSSGDDSELATNENLGHAIYLHYPNFIGRAKNALKIGNVDLGESIGDPDLPVGHAAVILVDKNGNSNYYEYGRYKGNQSHVIGSERRASEKGGNWRRISLSPQKAGESDSAYVARIQGGLPDTKTGAYQAMSIPSVDVSAATNYILEQANDKNRSEYGITNTCATGACNAVLPFRKKKEFNPAQRYNTEGYSIASRLWGFLPFTTDSYARDMRTAASDVFTMNDK